MKQNADTAPGTEPPPLVWQKLNPFYTDGGIFKPGDLHRTKVPGGWLVLVVNNATGLTFYPDPEHHWDGGSLSAEP